VTTPYRNEIDALRQRQEALEKELADVRSWTRQLDVLREREGALESELASIGARLNAQSRRSLPMLDQISVASPCSASWDEMVGDERVRFCLSCAKDVYNISAMPREEAELLLQQRAGGEVCVRYYKRTDGTIMTSDCPVGARRKRRKKLALAVAGAGAMAVAAATALTRSTCTMGKMAPPHGTFMQGEIAMTGAVAVPEAPPPETATPTPPEPPREVMGKPAFHPQRPQPRMGVIRPPPSAR
jgi:hypothetical protein